FNLLPRNVAGIAGIGNVDATQHLANDHLDVLVVDLHTLQTIHVLHFADDVVGQLLDALQTQDIVRIGRTVDDHFALVHHLAVVHQHLLFLGNQELVADAFQVGNYQTLLALGVLTERDRAGNIGKHAGVFGRTGLEQLGHAWQTPGNIARLLRFLRNTSQHFTNTNLLAVAHGNQRAHRERNVHHVVGTGNLQLFAGFVQQLDLRTLNCLASTRLGRNGDERRQTGDFVDLAGNRNTFLDVLEAHLTGVLGDDRACQRIPCRQTLTGLDDFAVANRQGSAVRHLMTL